MANARTRYDTIVEYMIRTYGASSGTLYTRPCAMLRGNAFLVFKFDAMVFRLSGRARLQALALSGSGFWDPLDLGRRESDWILIPEEHFMRWDRFAIESLKLAREGFRERPLRTEEGGGPAAPPPAAQRWFGRLRELMDKAAGIGFAPRE